MGLARIGLIQPGARPVLEHFLHEIAHGPVGFGGGAEVVAGGAGVGRVGLAELVAVEVQPEVVVRLLVVRLMLAVQL